MIKHWSELKYWETGEYQVVQERLSDLQSDGIRFNPDRKNLFRALRATPLKKVKVVLLGQDPYPSPEHASGIAFHSEARTIPSTLKAIFKEYVSDLHYDMPTTGNLLKWCKEGVLLWNVYPTCLVSKPASHHWDEWTYLTQEIVTVLQDRPVVFAALGSTAAKFVRNVPSSDADVIVTAHPSPLGRLASKHKFEGSRLFSTINTKLSDLNMEPIDWRLE